MTDLEGAKLRHPSSGLAGATVALLDRPGRSPGRAFLDALESLRMAIELNGPQSPQALFAHRAVDAARVAVEMSQDDPTAA